jgi:hypothetical protein
MLKLLCRLSTAFNLPANFTLTPKGLTPVLIICLMDYYDTRYSHYEFKNSGFKSPAGLRGPDGRAQRHARRPTERGF